jgi:hypothetical protein
MISDIPDKDQYNSPERILSIENLIKVQLLS